jgi:hypothetical protein
MTTCTVPLSHSSNQWLAASAKLASGPLSSSKGQITDASGQVAHITGINWFGMETGFFVLGGLDTRN